MLFESSFRKKATLLLFRRPSLPELTLKAEDKSDPKKAKLAMRALQSLREWGIRPYDLKSVEHGITSEFARRLIERGLLPEGEFNDGVILAETSLGGVPVLVSSDRHLLDISKEALQLEFGAADLNSVSVAHPRLLLKALY